VHTPDEYAKWAAENLPATGGPAAPAPEKKAEIKTEGQPKS
jgi:hypothetical protein